MSARLNESTPVRFGPFEFDAAAGELRKRGIKVRLQGKPAQLLAALVARPGQVVSREDLRQRLWPDDTFVDFESGLNTAVKRLRDVLGDSSGEPRYIETHHRAGYRFVADVEPAGFAPPAAAAVPAVPTNRWILPAVCAILAGSAAVVLLARSGARPVEYQQVSYRSAPVTSARFGPDGKTILYSAHTAPAERQVFLANGLSPESRRLDNLDGHLAAVSSRGELALLRPSGTTPLAGSTLARAPMNGGAPLEVHRSVMSADWSPDGAQFALARAAEGAYRLEYPAGTPLYTTSGWLSNVRVHPSGDRVAFVHHPVRHDDSGSLMLVGMRGAARVLVKDWISMSGLAWNPVAGEWWFSGAPAGAARSLWAVSETGRVRPVAQAPGGMSLADIAADGRVLLARGSRRLELVLAGADRPPVDITWYDWSRVQEISADGAYVLFDESGDGAAGRTVTFLYRVADSEVVRIGEGRAMGLSSGNDAVLLLDDKDRTLVRLAPIGPGKPRELPRSGLTYQWVRFLPGDRELLAQANEPDKGLRLYRVPVGGGPPAAVTGHTVVRNVAVSPDGAHLALLDAEGRLMVYPLGGGAARQIPTPEPLAPILWQGDELVVQHVASYTEVPARVSRLHLPSGRLRPWITAGPADVTGVNAVTRVVAAPGLARWAFNSRRVRSELFVAHGLR